MPIALKELKSMTHVYTFKITYRGCEDKIWRVAEVSSNYTLAQLGYMILVTFDTLAYHLFTITSKDSFCEPDTSEDLIDDFQLLSWVKLSTLHLRIGDQLEMIYDFGCNQCFDIELTGVQEMPKGRGRAYPRIAAGEGRGIIDDLPADELLKMIHEIDRTGVSRFQSMTSSEEMIPWDYREYDLVADNALLKGDIEQVQYAYEECD